MQYAKLEWINNQPYSLDFNDFYFSTDNSLEETEYVFIEHNQLKSRFSSLETESFTVIETGFGTVLNFLAVAAHWMALEPKHAQLRYISIEKFPLTLADLARAHAVWPQLAVISGELLQYYTNIKSGINAYSLAGGLIQLDLHADDISYTLPLISQKADVW